MRYTRYFDEEILQRIDDAINELGDELRACSLFVEGKTLHAMATRVLLLKSALSMCREPVP